MSPRIRVVEVGVPGPVTTGGGSGSPWIGPYKVWANMLQRLDASGDIPDGGTFRLAYDGVETADLPFDVTSVDLEAALDAIPALTGKVFCYGAGVVVDPVPLTDDGNLYINIGLTDARPLAVTLADNSLTTGGNPTADPVVDFDVTDTGYVRLTTIPAGNILDDVFVDVVEDFIGTNPRCLFVSGDPGEVWHPPDNDYIRLKTDQPIGEVHFRASSIPKSEVMMDGGQYGDVPAVAMVDAPLFIQVENRSDDSAGLAHVYVKHAAPVAP